MKKIAVLVLAAGLALGGVSDANAIDFKAKGQWIMSFDYGQNLGFIGGSGVRGLERATKMNLRQSSVFACSWMPSPRKPFPAQCILKLDASSGAITTMVPPLVRTASRSRLDSIVKLLQPTMIRI